MTSEVAAALAERLDENAPFTASFDDDPWEPGGELAFPHYTIFSRRPH